MPAAPEYEYLVRFSEPATPTTWNYIGTTRGISTTSGDTPASTYVPPALGSLPTFQLSIFDGTDPVPNPRSSIGSVVLRDPTGVLDAYVSYVTDGGILQLRRGTPGANLSTFSTVAQFTTAGMRYDHNVKEFRLDSLSRILEASLLHENRYGGTGGSDGDATLTGIIRPYGIGQIFNAPPTLVNSATLIYQISDSAIYTIADIKEGGVALGFGTARADFAALAGSAPAPGAYDVCYSEGFFRLGSSPTLPITVDFTGDTLGGTPYLLRGNIAKRIVTRAGTGVLTSGQVDATSLAALNAAKTGTCGWYWNKEITKAAALNEIMEGCLGYWFVDLTGALILGYLYAPGSSPVKTYTFGDQTGIPTMTESLRPPRWQTWAAYQRNYFIVDRSQLAGAVSDADVQLYTQDAQWKYESYGVTQAAYPTSFARRFYSGLWDGTDAQNEASSQQLLLRAPYERWDIPIYEDPFTLAGYLGQRIAISGHSRYSWANPRTFVLVGVSWGANLVPTATLWG